MKIPVMFINGSLGAVCNVDLDEMLEKNVVVAFQRSSGLAVVGKDEIRKNRIEGSGSWKDRKSNRHMPENVILMSERSMLRSAGALEISQTRSEQGLLKNYRIASNLR